MPMENANQISVEQVNQLITAARKVGTSIEMLANSASNAPAGVVTAVRELVTAVNGWGHNICQALGALTEAINDRGKDRPFKTD